MSDTEAAILSPDCDITVGGETVTVREMNYGERLRYWKRYPDLFEAMAGVGSGDPDATETARVIEQYPEEWLALVAVSCGKPVEWVAGLPAADGYRLAGAVLMVNASFFFHRLIMRAAAASQSEWPKSSTPLSGLGTERSPR